MADHHIKKMAARETPYRVTVGQIELCVQESVYPTGEIGELFEMALQLPMISLSDQSRVLDYGTGTGYLAILAAKYGANVIAIDKNPAAVACAKLNAQQNQVSQHIDCRLSDNLSALQAHEKFDYILAGLPWEDAKPQSQLEMAFYDEHFAMRRDLAARAKQILKTDGIILMSYAERVQKKYPLEIFFENFEIKILAQRMINQEPHYILTLSRI